MNDIDLRVDWCSYEAAKYAVEHWHYSRTMPATRNKLNRFGIWEDDEFVGAIVYGLGASPSLGTPYGLDMFELCELQRIAMRKHRVEVSKCISMSIAKLKNRYPKMRLIVSFADQYEGHIGTIYQASNWLYTGETTASVTYFDKRTGQRRHPRNVGTKGRDRTGTTIHGRDEVLAEKRPAKHRYLYPLDRKMRRQIASMAQPYPKRVTCGQSVKGDTVGDQLTGAGSIPAVRSMGTN